MRELIILYGIISIIYLSYRFLKLESIEELESRLKDKYRDK